MAITSSTSPITISFQHQSISAEEQTLQEFREWCNACEKRIYYNEQGEIKYYEYLFPDETIIKMPL